MAGAEPLPEALARRPRRADARRNYEALVAAAREVFAAQGAGGSLEEIARRAQVGIGTLYRHFPTRRELLEAVYVDEVEALCQAAGDLAGLPPWDALVAWLHRFVEYVATKRALAEGWPTRRSSPVAGRSSTPRVSRCCAGRSRPGRPAPTPPSTTCCGWSVALPPPHSPSPGSATRCSASLWTACAPRAATDRSGGGDVVGRAQEKRADASEARRS